MGISETELKDLLLEIMATLPDGDRPEWLVERYVEQDPHSAGVGDARLLGFGVPVWSLIGYLSTVRPSLHQTAEDYELPIEAVVAAVIYYVAHKPAIDARIAANVAPAPAG